MGNDREKILRKIKNMIERTQHNGCSESEALAAAVKVGDMMNKYDVTMNEVQFANEEFVTYEIRLASKRTNFMWYVMWAIAKFTDTKSWMGWYNLEGSREYYRSYSFFGTKKDTMIVEYIYHVVENAINSEFEKYKNSDEYKRSEHGGRTKKANFINGITNRISRRLQEMKEEIERKNEEAGEMSEAEEMAETGEVRERSLIVYDKFDIVEKKYKEKIGIKLGTSYSNRGRGKSDKSSYESGVSAGDNVDINKAITGAKNKGQKLIG